MLRLGVDRDAAPLAPAWQFQQAVGLQHVGTIAQRLSRARFRPCTPHIGRFERDGEVMTLCNLLQLIKSQIGPGRDTGEIEFDRITHFPASTRSAI